MQTEEMRLDGNAVGGALRDLFAADVTGARVTCMGCGKIGPLGTLLQYGHTMGIVLRCPVCDMALLRIVREPGSLHVDMSGLSFMTIPDVR